MKTLPRNKEFINSHNKNMLEWLDVDTEINKIRLKTSKLSANQRTEVLEISKKRNEEIEY